MEHAKSLGIELHYVNTAKPENGVEYLRSLTGGTGFNDVICFAPVRSVSSRRTPSGFDGCLNFFAGPTDQQFKAEFNFYNVHYLYTHIVGTSGGNTNDMKEAIDMMTSGKINPAAMITHVGGLNAVVDTTLNLPKIRGGKKLIYTQIDLAPDRHRRLCREGHDRSDVCQAGGNLRAPQRPVERRGEKYLLANAKGI